MNIDLSSVGMEKGQQYETIITTINKNAEKNAAPIGVICKDKDKIMCRIFKNSTTLDNIVTQKEFVVNITLNPILFTLATIGNIDEDYFEKSESSDKNSDKDSNKYSNKESNLFHNLKDVDAYCKCKVISIKEAIKRSDPVRKWEANVIIAEIVDIKLNNKCAKAPNRGFYSLIESLVNFTRMDIVDNDKKDYFIGRFIESKRVINKVGSNDDKKAIGLLKKALEDKGYSIK